MLVAHGAPDSPDPLFPQSMLLPLSEPGGVQYNIDNIPGPLRPFVVTLGVPRPVDAKKHDTTTTQWDEQSKDPTSKDSMVVTDTRTDTYSDT